MPLCRLPRLVVGRGRHLVVLLRPASSGSFLLFGWGAVCPGPVALVSESCPCDPEAVALLLLLLLLRLRLRPAAAIKVAVLVVGALDCPRDHSVLRLLVPWVRPGPAVARLRIQIAARVAVAVLVGRVGAIAGRAGPSLCSMRGALERCVTPLLCRRRSRRRVAAAASWCTVT